MRPALFAVTLFLSAALLFVVQPMTGKVLLPLAGGTPAVWTTCLVFFQAILLLGYLYAHRLTALPPRRQVAVHLIVVLLGLAALHFLRTNAEWVPAQSDYPIFGITAFLTVLIGMPFFALSATAPLMQRWFAATGHSAGRDPYFLYAASNAGSLIGLLAYPFLIEPLLPLDEHECWWRTGYGAFLIMAAVCGLLIPPNGQFMDAPTDVMSPVSRPDRLRVLKWIALAALPSSLLLSVTAHLTTDVAPVPLLWVVPLALYLVSFVIVFSRWPPVARLVAGRVAAVALLALVIILLTEATEPIALIAAIQLGSFFVVALLCHGELAHDRPPREHLTTFYLALSVGGVLGGLFNAIIAPVLFARLGLVEYPLAIALAALVRPQVGESLQPLRLRAVDAVLVAGFTVFVFLMAWIVPQFVKSPADSSAADALALRLVRGGLMYGIPAVVAFALVRNPARFALCLGLLLLAGVFDPGPHGRTLLIQRNFFGTLRVTQSDDGRFIRIVHGATQHGAQRTDEPGPPRPLMYYHFDGPVGELFAQLPDERKGRVAIVGLGCGAMAAYAEPGQEWTFYEIDPAVVRIAEDERYFTFLKECQVRPEIVLGDARRQLARAPDGAFDLIVLDAFNSDAIPIHLLTAEAFALYARKLAPNGVLAFHLSNRYLDLTPLVARIAAAHDPPFAAWVNYDHATDAEQQDGKLASVWAVLARDTADLDNGSTTGLDWPRIEVTRGAVWTDDFSNLLDVWKRVEE